MPVVPELLYFFFMPETLPKTVKQQNRMKSIKEEDKENARLPANDATVEAKANYIQTH